jgi:hypothetical protein
MEQRMFERALREVAWLRYDPCTKEQLEEEVRGAGLELFELDTGELAWRRLADDEILPLDEVEPLNEPPCSLEVIAIATEVIWAAAKRFSFPLRNVVKPRPEDRTFREFVESFVSFMSENKDVH